MAARSGIAITSHRVLPFPFLCSSATTNQRIVNAVDKMALGMSKGDIFENDWLKLIFNAVAIANIADNAGTSPLTNLYVSLHTADPGEAGSQTTSEAAYTGYARIPVLRTSGGWVVTNNSVSPAANIDFGECTASPGGPITHFCVGTLITGTGKILYSGTVSPNITMAVGVIPRLKTTSTITED